ncbi:MAG: HlyC/CorC family transporter [Clostridia bacterium]|jgi:putative hemolysin|nr:HlyC/CorC family transporter [Clostridia bacterium]MBQ1963050.1 HlyC/CorC family transporter [Clostridia bacterium]MBQ5833180.1 HlyC/CorC family transporter [Clostridia bacterium]
MFFQLLLQLVLILLNAFFAATEIAVISLNEKKLKSNAEDGDKKAKKMLKIIEDPTRFLSTIQVGITLAGFLGSAFAADSFSDGLTRFFLDIFNIAPRYYETVDTVSVILITLILSYFTLVLGELVPKRIAMKHKEKLATAVSGVISVLMAVLKPIVWFLTVSTNGVLRIFGINPDEKEETVSEEDIVIMLDAGVDEGTLDGDDIEYIKNVFKLDRLTAADVMTQRNDMVALPRDISEESLLEIIELEGYSRIPLFAESIDRILGILHTKDFLIKHTRENFDMEEAIMAPIFVPETMHLDILFKEMQKNRTHIVIVVNEYGFTSGIVTMEDILEELVGEIWDEQDEEIEPITEIAENTYTVRSSTSIDEFFSFFELEADEEIGSTTVNGWLTEHFENIPKLGDSFTYNNLTVTVLSADETMTHEVKVEVTPPPAEEDEDEEKTEE